ncbi:hypothetical protein QBC32DRAFT_214757 [Pseudoneurospora amorphoporcata]|uniref:Uncharacterized protein n=1 Tax=Pseudoneurospora amorphoporcata TaxID=241081 RepID=A0AAN6NUY1_9PEZI|nr:hypothetical protein QBC32DRAFT_214757 [Pseudoneurospora amorphoporcata]
MVVLDNLSKQLAAIEKINAVRDALDRLKPRCLITDSVSPEDICQGQAFLRCMGLHEVAEWLAEYMGVSSRGRWYDDESRYVIKINGRLLDGDIPAEVASNVLGRIWREEQERANRFEKAGRAEAARASMRPPPPGLVNRSVLEIPLVHRSPDKDNVLTAQEAEQAARRLAELGLLVPEPGHYTVSVNGECVHLEEGLQARRIWNKELEAMRQAQRHRQQHAMAPPPRPAPREPKSPNSQTKDDLLSIGIDLSLHKPPSVYTGSPTLEARTAQFMAANKDLLAAIDKEDEEKDRLLRVIDDERGSRDVSEARTLRSNSVYSSRFPSEAPPVVPAATTTARTARNNRQANTVPANPSSSAHEIARRRQAELSREEGPSHAAEGTAQDNRERTNNPRRQVKNPVRERGPEKPRKPQAATEAGASNGTPHNASAGRSGSSRPVATAVTTQKEEARPVPVPTPSASETPASQKKTKFILKVGGRRVVSQSHITFKDTPATEPPVHASPPTLRRNLSEPTRRHRDISQERSFGGNATRDAPSPGSFNHSLPTRRSLFGTTREQQLSYLTSGTLNVSHDARGRVPTPPLGVFRHPPRAIRHQSHHQMPPPAGFPNRALTESGSHHQNESRPTGHLPSITPARTISPQVPSQAVAGRESPQTMRGTATEDIGKRHATRRQFHGEEQGGRGP